MFPFLTAAVRTFSFPHGDGSFHTGCRLEYLSPYSPDFNPIEQAFSVIKAHLRRIGMYRFPGNQLFYEMYRSCDVISPEMTWGFFAHSGLL